MSRTGKKRSADILTTANCKIMMLIKIRTRQARFIWVTKWKKKVEHLETT